MCLSVCLFVVVLFEKPALPGFMVFVTTDLGGLVSLRFLKSLTPGAHYNSRSVCLSVCLFVCLSATILALQATRRLMSDTNSFSATRARKLIWRFC